MPRYWNIQRIYASPFFARFKSHFCPECKSEMVLVKRSKIVNPKSEEAAGFDFSFGETRMIGNTKFVWDEFKCPKCGFQISIKDMRALEKERK